MVGSRRDRTMAGGGRRWFRPAMIEYWQLHETHQKNFVAASNVFVEMYERNGNGEVERVAVLRQEYGLCNLNNHSLP